MKRRKFIRNVALSAVGLSMGCIADKNKKKNISHILTLSFDDGFKNSFIKTAGIFEKYNLPACFNVMAAGHFPDFKPPDQYMESNLGDFQLWNQLVKQGHEVMIHGWAHENLTQIPMDEAKALIEKSIDYFSQHLDGFDPGKAVFNFPFNASTPELNEWTITKVRAVRTIVKAVAVNPFPDRDLRILDCESSGPENIDKVLDKKINEFLESKGGWFIFNTHGLDGEGWGPMNSFYLDKLLAKLIKIPWLEILPTGKALMKYSD